jgi:hypothetical protein
MQQNDQQIGDRAKLTLDERSILEHKVLPTARHWIGAYPKGSSMYDHAEKTLIHWGETA